MSTATLDAIRDLLSARKIPFRDLRHAVTLTSEESARARGEELKMGGKALLLRCDDQYGLFVLPADRKLDSAAIRRSLPCRRLRFATPAELLELTGLVPGSVPPFGPPVLPFPLHLDSALTGNDRIAFNAGSLTDSIVLAMQDYLQVAEPVRILDFSLPPE